MHAVNTVLTYMHTLLIQHSRDPHGALAHRDVHTHTYIHTGAYTYIQVHAHTYIQVHAHTHILHIYTHTDLYTHTHTHTHIHTGALAHRDGHQPAASGAPRTPYPSPVDVPLCHLCVDPKCVHMHARAHACMYTTPAPGPSSSACIPTCLPTCLPACMHMHADAFTGFWPYFFLSLATWWAVGWYALLAGEHLIQTYPCTYVRTAACSWLVCPPHW